MQSDILFDNIYIGHSVADALKLQNEGYDVKAKIEQAAKDAMKPKFDEKAKLGGGATFMEDPIGNVRNKIDIFTTIFKRDPMAAIRAVPEITGVIVVILGVVISALFAVISINSAIAADKAKQLKVKGKEAVITTKEKVAEAVTTGAEKAQSELNKRTTRSSVAAEE